MKVVVSDINTEKGTQVVDEIKSNGGEAAFCKTDVSNEDDMKRLVEFAVETYGRLDGLVNNAGIAADSRPTHEYPMAEFDRLMSIDLRGVFMGMKFAVETILNQNRLAGSLSILRHWLVYWEIVQWLFIHRLSMAGVVGLTKSAALDYAPYNITVNAICPGTFRTSVWGQAPEEVINEYAKIFSPNGRLGDPKEVGHLALFLASDLARYISGTAISIDAGSSAGKITPTQWAHPEILE